MIKEKFMCVIEDMFNDFQESVNQYFANFCQRFMISIEHQFISNLNFRQQLKIVMSGEEEISSDSEFHVTQESDFVEQIQPLQYEERNDTGYKSI